jgi:salicylate hydroxylase
MYADAVHAVTPALGQGANLAFEDGLELALQLSSASDLRFSFKTFTCVFNGDLWAFVKAYVLL